jgi:hypothetical protein
MVIYLYVTLLLIQMSLFNLVVVGVVIVYFLSLHRFLAAFQHRQEMQFRTAGLKRFLEEENNSFYNTEERNVLLIGGEMGRWLELQLPEDTDEMKRNQLQIEE